MARGLSLLFHAAMCLMMVASAASLVALIVSAVMQFWRSGGEGS